MRAHGVLIAFLLAYTLSAASSLAQDPPANTRSFHSSLPLVHVRTAGKKAVTKEEQSATVTVLTGARNSSADLMRVAPSHQARIKVRGYSSAKMSKKQYSLELVDESGEELEVPFLGLPAHAKWVLGAPYVDRALVRNELAFGIASGLTVKGQPWYAPRTRSFEFFLNGEYQGVYVLTEKIDRSKARLGLGKINYEEPEQSPFMLEVEESNEAEEGEYFVSADKGETNVFYYEPKPKKLSALAKKDPARFRRMTSHIQGKFNRFESAIRAIERGDTRSYRGLVEPESFANFILMQEVFKNLDGYRRSLFLHWKDGRFHMGPVWDFDLTLGGIHVFGQRSARGFQVGHGWYIDGNPEMFWFRTMLKDPAFQRAVVKRYRELRRPGQVLSTGHLLGQLDAHAKELQASGAARRNFSVWDPNGRGLKDGPIWLFVPKYSNFSYDDVVLEHKKWLLKRLEWLDENFDEIGE